MKSLTPKQIVALDPCEDYTLGYLKILFGGAESLTYLEILDTNEVPLWDIIWLFCQPDVLSIDIRNQWLEIIATRAVTNHALHCGVDDVEEWAKNWLSGVDRTAEAACSARNAAAYAADTAHAAAYTIYVVVNTTTYAAVYATDTAHAAACGAGDAASDAATYAAHATAAADDTYITALKIERKQQIQDLKDILQGEV